MNAEFHFYWSHEEEGDSRKLPDSCRNACEGLWETALRNMPDYIDIFHDCQSTNLAHEDMSLQGGPGNERWIGMLTRCETHSEDAFAEEYLFVCPNS